MTDRGRLLLATCMLFLLFGEADARTKKKPTSTCNIAYPSDANVEWECRRLKRKETLESLFGDQWRDVARFNRIDRRHPTPGFALKVPKRLEEIAGFTPMPPTYPPFEQEAKAILVDLSEQFLGAYENGRLVFSTPVASGDRKNPTPTGEFRIDAFDRNHRSSLYKIEKTSIPYPMHYALRFFVNRRGIAFWLHGRDVPGYPASHGCVGLYDEEMQKKYYKTPQEPLLEDAKALYEWVVGPGTDDDIHRLKNGPKVIITGTPPM
jgi:L,D-transpeptidase-like protein